MYLDKIRPHLAIVVTTDKEQGDFKEEFLYDGRYGMNGECMIFPSKDQRDWSKFQRPFVDGDVVVAENTECCQIFLLKYLIQGEDNHYDGYCYFGWDFQYNELFREGKWSFNRPATEEEKAKLFKVIKDNGYKWNAETKTLEKLKELTESKEEEVDDEIVMSGIYFDRKYHANEVELHLGDYEIEIRDGKTYAIFKNQETKTLKPKFKVGDTIKIIYKTSYKYVITEITDTHYTLEEVENKFQYTEPIIEDKNWELVPNKFDLTTLKPFNKVLVRCSTLDKWRIQLFEKYDKSYKYPIICMGHNKYKQCIPYEGNEHLLDTTDECDEFYKTWE